MLQPHEEEDSDEESSAEEHSSEGEEGENNSSEDDSGLEDSSEEESSEGEEAEPQEIVIDEDVDNLIRTGALRNRLQDRSLGEGTITLIIRDPNISIIGDMNIDWDDQRKAPLYWCKSLHRVDLKGCTKLTQLGDYLFYECSSLTSVELPDGITQLGNTVFWSCSSLTSVALPDGLTQMGDRVFMY